MKRSDGEWGKRRKGGSKQLAGLTAEGSKQKTGSEIQDAGFSKEKLLVSVNGE